MHIILKVQAEIRFLSGSLQQSAQKTWLSMTEWLRDEFEPAVGWLFFKFICGNYLTFGHYLLT